MRVTETTKPYKIKETAENKVVYSPDYNYFFNKKTGFFLRWGQKLNDNPNFCNFGPEILDIEVTTQCTGPGGKLCPFCYKGNTPNGTNMSLETFKKILDKMPDTLTQIAFGADAHATSNPDLFAMMEYARSKEVVPNITVADITDEVADKLAKLCGAVAVSRYENKDICYDSVKKLSDRGLEQVNIHYMISRETYEEAFKTIDDSKSDERLKGLNAIVFLSLKQKGRGTKYNSLTKEEFKALIDYAFEKEASIGFDSCSAPKFLLAVKERDNYEKLEMMAEPCESSCFSSYINVEGKFFPCSFAEEAGEWKEGIDVANCNDFVKDIWHNPRVEGFRDTLLKCNRNCPLYNV